MATATVSALESTYQKTQVWLNELHELGHFENKEQAYTALRAVLHALRDRLPLGESTDLAAQLPMMIRGCYYEGWNPSATPIPIRHLDEFLASVEKQFSGGTNIDANHAVHVVFQLLARKTTAGEINEVKGVLPKPLQALWPQS